VRLAPLACVSTRTAPRSSGASRTACPSAPPRSRPSGRRRSGPCRCRRRGPVGHREPRSPRRRSGRRRCPCPPSRRARAAWRSAAPRRRSAKRYPSRTGLRSAENGRSRSRVSEGAPVRQLRAVSCRRRDIAERRSGSHGRAAGIPSSPPAGAGGPDRPSPGPPRGPPMSVRQCPVTDPGATRPPRSRHVETACRVPRDVPRRGVRIPRRECPVIEPQVSSDQRRASESAPAPSLRERLMSPLL